LNDEEYVYNNLRNQ